MQIESDKRIVRFDWIIRSLSNDIQYDFFFIVWLDWIRRSRTLPTTHIVRCVIFQAGASHPAIINAFPMLSHGAIQRWNVRWTTAKTSRWLRPRTLRGQPKIRKNREQEKLSRLDTRYIRYYHSIESNRIFIFALIKRCISSNKKNYIKKNQLKNTLLKSTK